VSVFLLWNLCDPEPDLKTLLMIATTTINIVFINVWLLQLLLLHLLLFRHTGWLLILQSVQLEQLTALIVISTDSI
jgi:hypothetical protein